MIKRTGAVSQKYTIVGYKPMQDDNYYSRENAVNVFWGYLYSLLLCLIGITTVVVCALTSMLWLQSDYQLAAFGVFTTFMLIIGLDITYHQAKQY